MKLALVGNQNCGKTTLFNNLTGSSQRVGNFPGVTVESKQGFIKDKDLEIIDLPGIYSLSPYSEEEIVTRNYLIKEEPDIILNIIDVTNIERNLYLTLQLIELGKPMIIALNMMDEMIGSGNVVNITKLSEKLGVKCLPIIASKGEGVKELLKEAEYIGRNQILPKVLDICSEESPIHRAIHSVMLQILDHSKKYRIPARYAATHLLEEDRVLEKELHLSQNEIEIIEHMIKEMETETGYDNEISVAMMRYEFIDNICKETVKRKNIQTKEQVRSNKIDNILTNKYFAFPIFFLLLGFIFYLTFDLIGGNLQGLLEILLENGTEKIRSAMTKASFSPFSISLLCDGIIGAVGSVMTFLPVVVLLFFFLSLLEDSGYMARIAFIMDKPLRKIGLSGRSFVPMLVGFGCSVPAVMSTKTLTSKKDKKLTLMLIPFMPCTAKLPILTVLCAAFFGKFAFWVMLLIYVASIILGILVAAIIQLIKRSKPSPFMLELPAYRIPTCKNTIILMWEKAKDFIKKAFTIVFIASLVIWFLSSFDLKLNFISGSSNDSILANIARFITPIFNPIGVYDFEVTSAIIAGLSAKESVVSTLEILSFNLGNISLLQGFSLLMFLILYMPCIATFSVMCKELKSHKLGIMYMLCQTIFAYLVSLAIFQIGRLFI